ncbi:MAG: hypothetical protein IJK67_01580 [Bacilli bacterium]|nr:hypothetical protein [Bacilli bacterium]
MENLTNQILELDSGKKYFVLRQALYKGVTYYLAVEVTEDEENFTNNFLFFERIDKDGKFTVKEVTDENILTVLAKNIKIEQ